jgi:hypothetical protein
VEIYQRLQECKDRCVRYNLLKPELFFVQEHKIETKDSIYFGKDSEFMLKMNNYLNDENKKLKKLVSALQEDLQSAENEIVEAQQELFEKVCYLLLLLFSD